MVVVVVAVVAGAEALAAPDGDEPEPADVCELDPHAAVSSVTTISPTNTTIRRTRGAGGGFGVGGVMHGLSCRHRALAGAGRGVRSVLRSPGRGGGRRRSVPGGRCGRRRGRAHGPRARAPRRRHG